MEWITIITIISVWNAIHFVGERELDINNIVSCKESLQGVLNFENNGTRVT